MSWRSICSVHPYHLGALDRVILLSFDVVCNGFLQKCLDLLLPEDVGLQDTVCDRCSDCTLLRSAPFRVALSMGLCLSHLAVPFRCCDVCVFSDDLFWWPREHTCSIVHQ